MLDPYQELAIKLDKILMKMLSPFILSDAATSAAEGEGNSVARERMENQE